MKRVIGVLALCGLLLLAGIAGCTSPAATRTAATPAAKTAEPPVGEWSPLAVDAGSGRQVLSRGELPLALKFDAGGKGTLSGTLPGTTAGDKPSPVKATFTWMASADKIAAADKVWAITWVDVTAQGGNDQAARGLVEYLFGDVGYSDTTHEIVAPNKDGKIYFMRVKR